MLESRGVVSAAPSEKTKTKKKEKKNSSVVTTSLYRAISSFLEDNGLTETLAALRSEAKLGVPDDASSVLYLIPTKNPNFTRSCFLWVQTSDGCGVPVLDLREMVRKCLELRYLPILSGCFLFFLSN